MTDVWSSVDYLARLVFFTLCHVNSMSFEVWKDVSVQQLSSTTVKNRSPILLYTCQNMERLWKLQNLTPVFLPVLSRSGWRRPRKRDGSVPGNEAAAAGELDAQWARKAAGHRHRAWKRGSLAPFLAPHPLIRSSHLVMIWIVLASLIQGETAQNGLMSLGKGPVRVTPLNTSTRKHLFTK